MFDSILKIASSVLGKVIPDKAKLAEANAELMRMQLQGELERDKVQISVMLAEAKSKDKWTSRARPSFLYVFYALLLWAIPLSLVYAVSASTGQALMDGMKLYFQAFPPELWATASVVILGYQAARTYDKRSLERASGNLKSEG